jgi:hypothetical protein
VWVVIAVLLAAVLSPGKRRAAPQREISAGPGLR